MRGPDIKQQMIGPLTFSIDRLIAIFESITESNDRDTVFYISSLSILIEHLEKTIKQGSPTAFPTENADKAETNSLRLGRIPNPPAKNEV